MQEKISTLAEFDELVGFAFGPIEIDEKAWDKVMGKDGAGEALVQRARGAGSRASPSTSLASNEALRPWWSELDVKPGAVFQPLRVAITGRTVSAGVFESVALLGTGRDACAASTPRWSGWRRRRPSPGHAKIVAGRVPEPINFSSGLADTCYADVYQQRTEAAQGASQ